MSAEQILELSQEQLDLATFGFKLSLIFTIVFLFFFLLFMHQRKKLDSRNLMYTMLVMAFAFTVLLLSLISGIDASIISNSLKKDSIEMVTLSTSGTIEDEYSKSKTSFVVINHKSFIIDNYSNISVGEKYNIEYLSNSGLIVEMKKIGEW